ESTVVASIHALKQSGKNVVSQTDFKQLQEKLAKRDADEVVAKAVIDGKITPEQKDWATQYAKDNLDGFKIFVAKAPVVVPVGALPDADQKLDATKMSDSVLTVAKMMDVDEADLKTFGGIQ
ncbi:hypothetical protein JYT18_01065, partial [Desulfocapsa sp. AH-315-J15]|nr:hypothetical protein [Desulfocapsa sp. AH-315-J15]